MAPGTSWWPMMCAVLGDAVAVADRGGERRGPLVEDVGEVVRPVHPPLVLDADAAGVVVPIARVPADVPLPHTLGHVSVRGAHDVVGGDLPGRVLEDVDRVAEGLLGDVDDDEVHRVRRRAARRGEVGCRRGQPFGGGEVGVRGGGPSAGRGQQDAGGGRGRGALEQSSTVHGASPGGGCQKRGSAEATSRR